MILLRLHSSGVEVHDGRQSPELNEHRSFTLGYGSSTSLDAPVLRYPAWGLLTQLRWETNRVEILVDHVGAYPLYIARLATEVWIGSDAWSVAKHARLQKMNPGACMEVLAYEFAIAPGTLIEGLQELPCGTRTIFTRENGSWSRSEQRTWQLEFPGDRTGDAQGLAKAAANVLRDTAAPIVERVRSSTDPLALNLSGGWDSRCVLASLLPLGKERLFTCTYGDENYSGVRVARKASAAVGIQNRYFPFVGGELLQNWFVALCVKLPPVVRFNLADGGYAVSQHLYGSVCGAACGHSGDVFTSAPFFPPSRITTAGELCSWLTGNVRSAYPRAQLRELLLPRYRELADTPDDHLTSSATSMFAPGFTGALRWKLENRWRRAAFVELRVLEERAPVVYAPMLHRDFIEFWAGIPPPLLVGQSLYKRMMATELFTGNAAPLAHLPREGGGTVREFGPISRWRGYARRKAAGLSRRIAPARSARTSGADPTVYWWRTTPALRQWAWDTIDKSEIVNELMDMNRLRATVFVESFHNFALARIGIWNLLTLAGVEQVLRSVGNVERGS